MIGGKDDDTYIVDEELCSGIDTVKSSVSHSIDNTSAADIEQLFLTGFKVNSNSGSQRCCFLSSLFTRNANQISFG